MFKGYKYRIYPTKEQQAKINQIIGSCRFVYNQTLSLKKETFEKTHKQISLKESLDYCRELENRNEWLKETDHLILTNSLKNLNQTFTKLLKQKKYPRYKSKHYHRQTYTIKYSRGNIIVDFKNNIITIPSLGKMKIIYDRTFHGPILSATISSYSSGKYYISLLVSEKHTPLPPSTAVIGIDMGIKQLCITSNGEKYENPKTLYKYEEKLAKLQRQLSHKQKGSKNYEKANRKVACCYEKIRNIRQDYIHKMTTKIIKENQIIIIEDLSILKMVQDSKLSKSIYDAAWYEITRQLNYKASWNRRTLIKIDLFYPSSQLCSNCGYKNQEVKKLSVRQWNCPNCGTHHDRDINAAKNILEKGLQEINKQ